MFGLVWWAALYIAVILGSILFCLVGLRRYNLLVRGTISIGLLGIIFAFSAWVSGQAEALATSLVAAAVGLGLAAVAVSLEGK